MNNVKYFTDARGPYIFIDTTTTNTQVNPKSVAIAAIMTNCIHVEYIYTWMGVAHNLVCNCICKIELSHKIYSPSKRPYMVSPRVAHYSD